MFFVTFFFLMLSMDDTLHKEDVLTIFDERKYRTQINFVSLVLKNTNFPQNFVVDECSTMSFPPMLHVTDNYQYACRLGQSKQTCTLLCSCSHI